MDRKLSVDILKILMAVMVVGIHANPLKPLGHDAIMLSGGGLYRLAVPVFFVINGYFLEPVLRGGGAGRYVRRILLLYLIWTALYLPAWYGILKSPDLWPPLRMLLVGWWQLWYLPGLALAAALVALVRNWSAPWLLAAMGGSFLAGVAIVYGIAFDLLHPNKALIGDATILHRNGLFMGFPFVLAGCLIRRHALDTRFGLPLLAALAVLGVALVMGESLALDRLAPKGAGHDNLLALGLASPALLLLALKFPRQSASKTLGTYSSGIYFIHVAFCVIGFRYTGLGSFWIFWMAVAGSVAVTWALIRSGLSRRLL